jgi:hypothetical protein
MWHYIYWYLIYYHPVYWLYLRAKQYAPMKIDEGIWLVAVVFGSVIWVAIARVFAEIPARKHGNMIIWWLLFTAFHIWTFIIYIIYDLIDTSINRRWKEARQASFSDLNRNWSWKDAIEKMRPPQLPRGKR